MKKAFILFTLLLSWNFAVAQSDEAAIRACSDGYTQSLADNNPREIWKYYDKASKKWFEDLNDMILTYDEALLRKQSYFIQYLVVFQRVFVSTDRLKMGSEDLFVRLTEMMNGTEKSVKDTNSLFNIKIAGNSATAKVNYPGEDSATTIVFTKEINEWKLNIVNGMKEFEALENEAAKKKSMNIDKLISLISTEMPSQNKVIDPWLPVNKR